jgi:hypothetical protein
MIPCPGLRGDQSGDLDTGGSAGKAVQQSKNDAAEVKAQDEKEQQ